MGNVHFEDRSRRLRDLPSLSTDFYMWLSLSVCFKTASQKTVHGLTFWKPQKFSPHTGEKKKNLVTSTSLAEFKVL